MQAQENSTDSVPPVQSDIVNEFVLNAHGNLKRVKELLAERPGLLEASWSWGGDDWETAMGAAAHMGNREIALYLVDQGARVDLFAAAMLREIEIVRAIVERFPAMRETPGTHGISLLRHARAGGPEAERVVRFLEGNA